jgi:hypothetical protein
MLALKGKPHDPVDRRFVDGMAKNGFFDRLWAEKR